MNKYAKALVAGVLAGGAAYESAVSSGASAGGALIGALVAAVVTGLTVWGVPNETVAKVETIGAAVEASPALASDVTAVLSKVK